MARTRRGWGEGSIYPRCRTKGPGHDTGDHRGCDIAYWVGQVEAGRCHGGHTKKDGTTCRGGERLRARIVRRNKSGPGGVIQAMKEAKERGAAGVAGQDPTVDQFISWWLDNVKAGKVSDDSLANYRKRQRFLRPHVGHIRLRRLGIVELHQLLAGMEAAGLGPASRQAAMKLLASALKHAKSLNRIVDNPCDYVSGPKVRAKTDDYLRPHEVDGALAAADGDWLYAILHLTFTLGNRQGELLALPLSGLDLDNGTFSVEDAKTDAGERTLPLVAGTLEVMKAHMERRAAASEEAGWEEHGLVFSRPDGRPLPPEALRDWWYDLQATAGIKPRRRWHATRHSAAQRMLDRGVPIEIVSAILGHSGLAITNDIYGRAKADRIRKALVDYD